MRINLPITKGAYKARSVVAGSQDLTNWYIESGADGTAALYQVPGAVLTENVGTAPVSVLESFRGVRVVVSGQSLYTVSDTSVVTFIGVLSGNDIDVAHNGVDMLLVDGVTAWRFDGTVLTTVTTPVPFSRCAYLNNRFLGSRVDSVEWYSSALEDITTWNGLDFDRADVDPDKLTALVAHSGEVWTLGPDTFEVWHIGTDSFPFNRNVSVPSTSGVHAPRSVVSTAGVMLWLGQTGQGEPFVVLVDGYTPQIISTPEIGYRFSQYAVTDDAFAFSYDDAGHTFYVLTFPTEGVTWAYDLRNKQWHLRSTYLRGRWRANCHVYHNGQHYIGDNLTGDIYRMDNNVHDDGGQPLVREVVTPNIRQDQRRIFMSALEVVFQPGVGLSSGQGVDPQAMLEVSHDGGVTWGNERWASIGNIGRYKDRARYHRLGSATDVAFRISVSDPVNAVMLGAVLDAEVGR